MAVTDEDLQKLGKPPIYSGKEDEWNEWSFVMKSYVSLLSTHVPALLTGAENPVTSPDMSICDNQSHSHRGWGDSSQETLPRLGDERERTSTGSDQRNHRHERSIGMASVDHEIRWIKDELLRMRTCWPHGQRLLVQGHKQGQGTQQQGQER